MDRVEFIKIFKVSNINTSLKFLKNKNFGSVLDTLAKKILLNTIGKVSNVLFFCQNYINDDIEKFKTLEKQLIFILKLKLTKVLKV